MTGSDFRCAVLGALALAAASLAPAAVASAQPTLVLDRPCYVSTAHARPLITLTGSGYTPRDRVQFSDAHGLLSASDDTYASATGTIDARIPAPVPPLQRPGIYRDRIVALDSTAQGESIQASATALLTAPDVGHSATREAPGLRAFSQRVTWSFSGFATGATVYGHFLYRGHLVAREAFGRASGPCGVLTARRRVLPIRPRHSDYAVQADTSRSYSPSTAPSVRLALQLTVH